MYERAVLGVVRVAFRAEADDRGILLIGNNAHDPVGRDGVFIQHEGDGLAGLDSVRVDLFDIDKRTGVICRLHRTGEYGEHLQADNPRPDQKQRQDHNDRDDDSTDYVPNLLERSFHDAFFLSYYSFFRPRAL